MNLLMRVVRCKTELLPRFGVTQFMTTSRPFPKLFASGHDSQMNSLLNFPRYRTFGYIQGYRRAADRLVDHVAETDRDQDLFLYPIAFMYRQHIELLLKQIIDRGRRLVKDQSGHPGHHKLHDLWPLAKGLIRETWNQLPDPEEFALVDHFIEEFSKVDPDSTAFRYPEGKDGTPTLQAVQVVNLRHLAECVHQCADFLSGAAAALSEYVQLKYEFESEFNEM